MQCIDSILKKIKENPLIYLGEISLPKLKTFLDGYLIRETEINGPGVVDEAGGFQRFIEEKFCEKTAESWSTIISMQYSDNKEAFNAFFDLMDEYRSNIECRLEQEKDTIW